MVQISKKQAKPFTKCICHRRESVSSSVTFGNGNRETARSCLSFMFTLPQHFGINEDIINIHECIMGKPFSHNEAGTEP